MEGADHALALLLLAPIEALPDDLKIRVWHRIDAAIEGGRTALLNRSDVTEEELDGFDTQVGAFRATREL